MVWEATTLRRRARQSRKGEAESPGVILWARKQRRGSYAAYAMDVNGTCCCQPGLSFGTRPAQCSHSGSLAWRNPACEDTAPFEENEVPPSRPSEACAAAGLTLPSEVRFPCRNRPSLRPRHCAADRGRRYLLPSSPTTSVGAGTISLAKG